MREQRRFCFFVHSMVSDWNHGNAHFLRGLVQGLIERGQDVQCFEEAGAWSLTNLMKFEGEAAIKAVDDFRAAYPQINVHFYKPDADWESLNEHLANCDVVVIHEWNDPAIVNRILSLKGKYGFKALFHDTHHRAVSALNELLKFHLHLFDGVLAFGKSLYEVYRHGLGIEKVWIFHEAADVEHFKPSPQPVQADLCWIGNWGDDERTRELEEFLIEPSRALSLRTIVHGVRYEAEALAKLRDAGIEYKGYLPNLSAPAVYSSSKLSMHVPRNNYTSKLAGVPTIRVFEALACGAPLVCAPWQDCEDLFRKEDYVIARNGEEMKRLLQELLNDDKARRQIAENGRQTVLQRHTCGHRAEQLLHIVGEMA